MTKKTYLAWLISYACNAWLQKYLILDIGVYIMQMANPEGSRLRRLQDKLQVTLFPLNMFN